MKKIKFVKHSLVVIIAFGLVGCGGGSGDSGTSTGDDGTTYNLKNVVTQNYSFVAPMSSSANNDVFEYTLSMTTQSKTLIDGKELTPIQYIGSVDNKTKGSSGAINSIHYFDDNGIETQTTNNTDGTICTLSNTPTPLPTNAKIGDSGIGSTLECTDGTMSSENWVLVKKDNLTTLKTTSTLYDSNNNISTTSNSYIYLNSDNKATSFSGIIYYVDEDVSLTIEKTTVNLR
jgi:hypothetical protein